MATDSTDINSIQKMPKSEAAKVLDTNGDGVVSKEEQEKHKELQVKFIASNYLSNDTRKQLIEKLDNPTPEEKSGKAGAARIKAETGLDVTPESVVEMRAAMRQSAVDANKVKERGADAIDKNHDGELSMKEAEKLVADTRKRYDMLSPKAKEELKKTAAKEEPAEKVAMDFERQIGLKVSPEVASYMEKSRIEMVKGSKDPISPTPTQAQNGSNTGSNAVNAAKGRVLSHESNEENEPIKATAKKENIGEMILKIIAMFLGMDLADNEKKNVAADVASKGAGSGKAPSTQDVAASTQRVTGVDPAQQAINGLNPQILADARKEKEVMENKGAKLTDAKPEIAQVQHISTTQPAPSIVGARTA